MRVLSLVVVGATFALAASCQQPTSADRSQLELHRAQWVARDIRSYQYDYLVTGFFINYAGKHIRLVVRDGLVQSATDASTGVTLPGPATQWPTIDRLFEQAIAAATGGSLRGVRFDPELGYPTEIDLAGPPDASGSLFATELQPIQ